MGLLEPRVVRNIDYCSIDMLTGQLRVNILKNSARAKHCAMIDDLQNNINNLITRMQNTKNVIDECSIRRLVSTFKYVPGEK